MTALATADVGLTINGVTILSDISLEVGAGELLAVIGPNGAGKTSLINVLSGLTPPTAGTVLLGDRDVTSWSPHRRAVAGIGRTFQTSNLLLGRTVLENVRLAARAAERRPLWRDLRAVSARGSDVETARESLELVGLGARADAHAGALSHGDRRKLELAVVLAQRSSVVLLDEPMAGVNTEDVDGLVELVRSVHRGRRTTVVMVEHHMNVVLDLAERIAVMHHGALLAVDSPDAVIANPVVQSAYVGESL